MTRNNNNTYRSKGRAVFLAALVVLSMIAVPMSFAGSAAALDPTEDTYGNALGGELVYQGQEFNVTNLNTSGDGGFTADISSQSKVYLLRITEKSSSGTVDNAQTVRPVTYNNADQESATIDTSDLDAGEYTLSDTSGVSSKLLTSFEVTQQTLSANWENDEATGADNDTYVELDTSRVSRQNVTVSADGLDAAQLKALFNASGDEVVDDEAHISFDRLGYDSDDDTVQDLEDDGYVTLDLQNLSTNNTFSDDELTANFTKLADEEGLPDDGEYTFDFVVTDTTAEASASISISEEDQSGSFSQGVYQTAAGDFAEFTIDLEDTDEAWVQIGDQNSGFTDIVHVEDDNDDDQVSFTMNTRLAGTDAAYDDVYESDDDNVAGSAAHGGTFDAEFQNDDGQDLNGASGRSSGTFNDYLYALDLIESGETEDDQLTRPLQAANYEVAANGNNVFVANDDDEAELDDELDSAVLELSQPQIGDITTYVAPTDDANAETELDSVLEEVTQRNEVAIDDRLVVQVEATGLYGAMANKSGATTSTDIFTDGTSASTLNQLNNQDSEGIDFSVEAESSTGNQEATSLNLNGASDDEVFVLPDNENRQFFVIVDTSNTDAWSNGAPDDGDSYTATLEYATDGDDRYKFASGSPPLAFNSIVDAYPYFQADSDVSSSTEINFADAAIEFDNLNVDDVLEAENVEDAEVSGTTNVAPGSDAELRVSSTDGASSSFRNGQSVNISEDGEVSGEFDFSNQEVDDEFTSSFRVSGSDVESVDSIIVEEGSLSEKAPEDDESEDDESDDGMSDDGTSSDDSTDDSSDDSTEEETPGFGALVALVAVLGAALLATRRQN